MATVFEIVRIKKDPDAAMRAEMGLGAAGVDSRDTGAWVQVREEDPSNVSVVAEFWYPYERRPMTPAALVPLIRAQARALVDGDLDGRGENILLGRAFVV